MCLGTVGRVQKVEGREVLVDFGGIQRYVVCLEEVREGELVVVHAGLVIGKMREEDYRRNIEEIQLLLEETGKG
jgi:hydrogenase expression/formation protein HypC